MLLQILERILGNADLQITRLLLNSTKINMKIKGANEKLLSTKNIGAPREYYINRHGTLNTVHLQIKPKSSDGIMS